jgi:hypothetical protein
MVSASLPSQKRLQARIRFLERAPFLERIGGNDIGIFSGGQDRKRRQR